MTVPRPRLVHRRLGERRRELDGDVPGLGRVAAHVLGDAAVQTVVGAHHVADAQRRHRRVAHRHRFDADAVVVDGRERRQRSFFQETHRRQRIARCLAHQSCYLAVYHRHVGVVHHGRFQDHLIIEIVTFYYIIHFQMISVGFFY